jgi:hypothetical protein
MPAAAHQAYSIIAVHLGLTGGFVTTDDAEGVAADVREAWREDRTVIVGFGVSNPVIAANREGATAAHAIRPPIPCRPAWDRNR